MLQHTSSEVIIFRLQINLNSKNTTYCTDWELTKLIDIKRQEYVNNRDKVSHCITLHLSLNICFQATRENLVTLYYQPLFGKWACAPLPKFLPSRGNVNQTWESGGNRTYNLVRVFFEDKTLYSYTNDGSLWVENKQNKHRLAAGFFEPEKKKKTQINSVSRFENRTD